MTLALRDGESIGAAIVQRLLGVQEWAYLQLPSGIGTGYSPGQVGYYNGPSGSVPNHLAIIGGAGNMTITCDPGWLTAMLDTGVSTATPKAYYVDVPAALSATVTSNATGSTRNDTVCLRVDQSTAPSSDGSNLVSLYIVPGASGGGISNAPGDGALYVPLANIAVPNSATTITQAEITDLRFAHPRYYKCRAYRNAAFTTAATVWQVIPFDTETKDPSDMFTVGAAAKMTCALAGRYKVSIRTQVANTAATNRVAISLYKNGSELSRGDDHTTSATVGTGDGVTCSDECDLAAGDYLQGFVFTSAAFVMTVGSVQCYISITYLGPS